MGLNCTHGAFDGAYSRFQRFRIAICRAMGGSYPNGYDGETNWYYGPGMDSETHPGLYILLCHSDCDGSMTPKECRLVANDLDKMVPLLAQLPDHDPNDRRFSFVEMAETFAAGCREAASKRQKLRFG